MMESDLFSLKTLEEILTNPEFIEIASRHIRENVPKIMEKYQQNTPVILLELMSRLCNIL